MTKKIDYYKETLKILKDLKTSYPNFEMGTHLAGATGDYPSLWGMTDKALYYALVKYKDVLDIEGYPTDTYITEIEEDAKRIGDPTFLKDDEEE